MNNPLQRRGLRCKMINFLHYHPVINSLSFGEGRGEAKGLLISNPAVFTSALPIKTYKEISFCTAQTGPIF